MVTLLLAAGADPNTKLRGGETALMTAARTGRPGPVKALLARVREADGVETAGPSFSWGYAHCPTEGTDFDELIALADTRLYEAKEANK